jgi:hypothetical protein
MLLPMVDQFAQQMSTAGQTVQQADPSAHGTKTPDTKTADTKTPDRHPDLD